MHRHFRLFDHLYREWLGRELAWQRQGKSRFGDTAMKMVTAALKDESVFAAVGEPPPVIEIFIQTDLGGVNPVAKVMPLELLAPVTSTDTYSEGSGQLIKASSRGGVNLRPVFIFSLGELNANKDRFAHRSTFKIDAHHMFRSPSGKKGAPSPYTVYRHSFNSTADLSGNLQDLSYIGVTRRSWKKRWQEHRRSMARGSRLKFHRAFRDALACGGANDVMHEILWVGDDEEMMLSVEEEVVDCYLQTDGCLNMIPGGKKGLAYLREHKILSDAVRISADQSEAVLEASLRESPRKGLPAPWVSERWKDDDWAVANICARDDRLSVEQVHNIRRLAKEHSAASIAKRIHARSSRQVQRVIDGRTYTRVK